MTIEETTGADSASVSTAVLERFEAWWEAHGQFCRAGGGDYEKTFAFRAWEAAEQSEREACALTCEAEEKRVDDLVDEITPEGNLYMAGKAVSANRCAKKIRARSNARDNPPRSGRVD